MGLTPRAQLEISVEGMINDYSVNGGSSRLLADKIVDHVLNVLAGKKEMTVDDLQPWRAFAIKEVVKDEDI